MTSRCGNPPRHPYNLPPCHLPFQGTAYAATTLGNLFSATFLESHFDASIGMSNNQNCRGPHVSFPIFRALDMSDTAPFQKRPVFYSTYGVDGVNDPYSAMRGFQNEPFQMFALDGRFVRQVKWTAFLS